MRDTPPLFKHSIIAIAMLSAMGASAGDAPVQSGFQVFGQLGNPVQWRLTAGNLLNGDVSVDIQTNSQQGAGFSNLNATNGISSIFLSTAGQTVASFAQNGQPKAGHGYEVTGSVGTWSGHIIVDSGAKNLSENPDDRSIALSLSNSNISGNILLEHAQLFSTEKNKNSEVYNNNILTFSNVQLTGDIKNVDNNFWPSDFGVVGQTYYLAKTGEKRNDNRIDFENGSKWVGDLVTTSKETNVKNVNQLSFDGATWEGQVHDNNDLSTVTLTNNSQWNATAGQSSKVEVVDMQKSQVTLQNGAHLDIQRTTGDARFKFESLKDTSVSVTEQKTNSTTVIADGQLNDGSLSREEIANGLQDAYNSSTNDAINFEIEQGLITNQSTGYFDAQGNAHFHADTVNTNLLTTSELVAIQMMQWRAEADDMNQRMGELRDSSDANGLWVRTYGGKSEATKVDNEFVGFQFGYDHNVASGANQQFVGGAISYTKGDANFSTGTGDNDTFAFTGYSTWLLDSGSYVDFSAKYGKLNSDFDINTGLGKLNGDYSTHALAMGVEVGHRFPVANLFYVEPQMAFTASHIFAEDFGAGQGVTIEQDSINSYVARAGLAAGIKCPDNKGSVWMKASYLYDFDGETTTTAKKEAMTNQFAQDFGGGWYELGLGASVNFTKNLHGYADFEYASGAEIETPYKWNVGVRYTY